MQFEDDNCFNLGAVWDTKYQWLFSWNGSRTDFKSLYPFGSPIEEVTFQLKAPRSDKSVGPAF